MKIKVFNHNDFDAVGCGILAILALGEENVDITYCGYDNINNKVKEFIDNKEYNNFDHVYITDISVNEELAEYITNYHPESFKNGFTLAESFTLLDHHPTSLGLNKYWWCNVTVEDENGKLSGTKMFYNHILDNIPHKIKMNVQNIKDFVETVRQYDTWEWQTRFNNEEPKMWNDLLYVMGRDEFIKQMIFKLKMYDIFDFNDFELLMLKIEEDKKKNYIEARNKELQRKELLIDNKQYVVGVVFAEQYISQLGNELAKLHPEYDFIIMISGGKTVSYRGIKDDIDLGLIAKHFGGGGHPKASGSQISDETRQNIIDLILK